MEKVAPEGGAPRLLVTALPRPEEGPPSLSVRASMTPPEKKLELDQSGSVNDAMKPGSVFTKGSTWNSQTLARVPPVETGGRELELNRVKLVPLKWITWI